MFDAITETLIAALAKSGAEILARRLAIGWDGKSSVRSDFSSEALARHLIFVKNWASEITFNELRQSRGLQQSFIDLDLELDRLPTRERLRERKTRVSDLRRVDTNILLLGDPGAGKTTSLQHLALGFLTQAAQEDPPKGPPILVLLRMLEDNDSLAETILEALGVQLDYPEGLAGAARSRFRLKAVSEFLSSLGARLLVDGLDEIHPRARTKIVAELTQLLLFKSQYRIFITCRTAEAIQVLPNTQRYAIEPLTDKQIELFALKWLGEAKAKDLLRRVRETPYGGSEVLPLTLAHLCAIYERTGSVPKKPKTIYRKIVHLLLEDWNEEHSIQRPSAYANFEVDRKIEFLRAIAYELTLRGKRGGFDHYQLDRAYRAVCLSFALPNSECRKVVREIESHNGLILEVDFERFDFAHRSIQEFLTASYILGLPVFPEEIVAKFPNEMALVVALSSNPVQHFQVIVEVALRSRLHSLDYFSMPFLRRLFLEKVDFRPDPRLGRSIAELFSATFYPSVRQVQQMGLPFEVSPQAFRDLIELEGVHPSLKLALRGAVIAPNGGTWRVEWKDQKEKPPGTEYTVVDSGFLRLAEVAV